MYETFSPWKDVEVGDVKEMSEIGIPAQEIKSVSLQDRGTGRLFLPVVLPG